MFRAILFAPLLAVLTSCLATSGALDRANATSLELRAAVTELQATQLDPTATQGQLEGLTAQVEELGTEAAELWAAVPEAAADDIRRLEETAKGVLNFGAAGDATGIAGIAMLGLHLWRDRRKRRGGDPIQDAGVFTPPPANPTA